MEVKKGYKRTKAMVVPIDWDVDELANIKERTQLGGNYPNSETETDYPLMKMGNIGRGFIDLSKIEYITEKCKPSERDRLCFGDILFNTRNTLDLVGKVAIWKDELPIAFFNSNIMRLEFRSDRVSSNFYMNYMLNTWGLLKQLRGVATGTTSVAAIYTRDLFKIAIPLAPLPEQSAIATVLSDVDALINSLEKLIAKKRNIKQRAMQELLTGKKRLPGFSEEWDVKTLFEMTDCLDNLRVPLNDKQRSNMKGDYPYCGANGVLDFINEYMIDDDIILIAEDGGYFDEYAYRPIAYRMRGKCWVNNHAHILKAKENFSQDYIFYSLVHKNILSYLASGTRAKLNKSEMYKIQIDIPRDRAAQNAIGQILSDMDVEIEQLERKRDKYRMIKQGMMQELLTGKTRLV